MRGCYDLSYANLTPIPLKEDAIVSLSPPLLRYLSFISLSEYLIFRSGSHYVLSDYDVLFTILFGSLLAYVMGLYIEIRYLGPIIVFLYSLCVHALVFTMILLALFIHRPRVILLCVVCLDPIYLCAL